MRILHTSDWHLGRTLERRSRLPEQRQFIDELCDICDEEQVEMVLVAGDVFDTYNPPAEAENLFYDALERLANGGRRAVVVIAGNHDSPERIHAANPLALKYGISLIGFPGEHLPVGESPGGISRVRTGRGWIELRIPGVDEPVVVTTLAYPSESRLNELLGETLDEPLRQAAYSERVRLSLQQATEAFRDDTVNIIVSHLFVRGGTVSESERSLGGALMVHPDVFPPTTHYVGLGHLHRPQRVGSTSIPCRYSGSPLAYSFSESGQQKEVVIVEALPGARAEVRSVKLTAGKQLKQWRADSLSEVYGWCEELANLEHWVDLEVKAQQPLTSKQLADLRRMHPGIVNIRVVLPERQADSTEQRLSELSLDEQFRLFVARQRGAEPNDELVELFQQLVHGDPHDVLAELEVD